MKINTDGNLPDCYARLDQLGLKIALGMENYPSNRMVMCYGNPGGGKSTFLYSLMGQYLRNDDEVYLVDAERAVDRIYLASYMQPLESPEEEILEALKFQLKTSESRLKKEAKASQEARESSDEQVAVLEKRVALLPQLIKDIKAGIETPVAEGGMDPRTKRSLIRRSISDYRLRKISIVQYDTLEEFEKETIKMIEERKADPERKHKRLLIGVDSINYLLPAEVLERATCSEGSNFVVAKYLHTLLPKLITKLSGTETSIFFIHQKTKTIKMSFWEKSSPIDDVATKGGSAAKFGATIMIGVEKGKKIKGIDDQEYDSGVIDIPKAKLRGGSKGTYKGVFFLKESIEKSLMDFNEPFIMAALNDEKFGIRKNRGKFYIPASLLEGHPEMETTIRPALAPFPKEEANAESELYYHAKEPELVALLEKSPSFEEICLLGHDIMKDI